MGGRKVTKTEVKELLACLTEEQTKILKKDYIFRTERNLLICELRQRGVAYPVLAKASGMSKNGVFNICSTSIPSFAPVKGKQLQTVFMKKMRKAFNAFYREIEIILKTERR